MEYTSENVGETIKGKEVELLEDFMAEACRDETYVDEAISFLEQAVGKLKEKTAADC